MIAHLLDTVGPVFLLVLAGYIACRLAWFSATTIDALMSYAIRFAIPCLLFRAVSTIDLETAYEWRTMSAFYLAALVSFSTAAVAARWGFGRRPGEAVAVGFAGLFSNLVLLGLPIVRMTFGEAALPTAYAVLSLHAPFCYLTGIVAMELARADGRALPETAVVVLRTIFRNNLTLGIGLGFLVNFSGVPVPDMLGSALDMVSGSALPIALVGLGGVLTRYALSERLGETGMILSVSLILQPLLTLALCMALNVDEPDRKVVVLMAAMSPGVNVYLFASLYRRAEGSAAAAVLVGTVLAAGSVSVWSWLLTG